MSESKWAARIRAAQEKAQAAAEKVEATQKKAQEKQRAALGPLASAKQAVVEGKQADWSSRGILFEGMSHEEGRNAKVTLYPDRIERVKERSALSLSSARQDVEVTPIKSVSSVQAKKDSMRHTKVTVYASGNNIDFRFGHDEASRFRQVLMNLIMNPAQQPSQAPTPPAAEAIVQLHEPDPMDQLRKLAELRDAGILSAEEFEAKKTEMLKRL